MSRILLVRHAMTVGICLKVLKLCKSKRRNLVLSFYTVLANPVCQTQERIIDMQE
jgi:hypothetical protein